jgi:hypothetical protein
MSSLVRIIDVFTKNQAHYKSSLYFFDQNREQLTEYENTGVEGENEMVSRSFIFSWLTLWLFHTEKMSLAALKDPKKSI